MRVIDLLEELGAARIERVVEIEDPCFFVGKDIKVGPLVRRDGFDGESHSEEYRAARLRLHRLVDADAK